MKRSSTLTERYKGCGRLEGNELLLKREDALRFIDDCKRFNVLILGMDFFIETGDGDLTELPGVSADYSSLRHSPNVVEKSANAAKALIAKDLPCQATWVSVVIEK